MNSEILSSISIIFKESQQESLFSRGPEVVKIPNKKLAIAWGAWGEALENNELIRRFAAEKDRKMIETTLITWRYHDLPHRLRKKGEPLFSLEEKEKLINIGAQLTRLALWKNGWQDAELLIVTASIPPCSNFPEEIAQRANLGKIPTRCCYLACNGVPAALLDVLQDKDLRETRVVITAVEGLSPFIDFKDPASVAIFGNLGAAMAFLPYEIELLGGKTVVKPDRYGVIRVPKAYDLPALEERQDKPEWYELEEGANEVFAFTKKGVMMLLPPSTNLLNYIEMDGSKTAKLFGRIAAPLVGDVLIKCFPKGISLSGSLLVISHQPSGVVRIVNNRIERERIQLQRELGIEWPRLEIPWVLDRAGVGNGSSATFPVALAKLAKDNQIPKENPFIFLGFGIGSSASAMGVKFKRIN